MYGIWNVYRYRITRRPNRRDKVGIVEASTEQEAIQKASKKFKCGRFETILVLLNSRLGV